MHHAVASDRGVPPGGTKILLWSKGFSSGSLRVIFGCIVNCSDLHSCVVQLQPLRLHLLIALAALV